MKKHYKIQVSGRVQGVGYRAFVKKQAEALDLRGIVKNEEKGGVYVEVEGLPNILEEFLNLCRKGPELSRVDKLVYEPGILKNYTFFEITY